MNACLWRRAEHGLEVLEIRDGGRWRLPSVDEVDVPTTIVRGEVCHVCEVAPGYDPGVSHRWVDEAHAGLEVQAALAQCGASIVVWRRGADGAPEYLLLHRAARGPEYDGDWAWTPPGGGLAPGESHEACAARELREEAGLVVEGAVPLALADGFAAYAAELPDGQDVVLSDEHDRFEWLPLDAAVRRCRPDRVADTIRAASRVIA